MCRSSSITRILPENAIHQCFLQLRVPYYTVNNTIEYSFKCLPKLRYPPVWTADCDPPPDAAKTGYS